MVKSIDRLILRLILLISICVLLIVFVAQFIYDLEPCILCKFQRIPYFAAILFVGLALHIKKANQAGTVKVIGFIFIVGAVLAFYHNGVEQYWWNAATGCGNSGKFPISFENFQSQLIAKMPKRCDQIDWTLFGYSMTVYNMLLSIILAALCLSSGLFDRNTKRNLVKE